MVGGRRTGVEKILHCPEMEGMPYFIFECSEALRKCSELGLLLLFVACTD